MKSDQGLLAETPFTRQLLDLFGGGIMVTDEQSTIQFINDSGAEILGYATSELEGKNLRELVSPEDLHKMPACPKESQKNKAKTLDLTYIGKDGNKHPVRVTISPRFTEKKCTGCYHVFTDLTGNRKAEERSLLIEFMVNHAAEGIFLIKRDGRILYANEAGYRKLEYTKEEILEKSAWDIDSGFTEETVSAIWNKLQKETSFTIESTQLTKNGKVIPAEVTATYLPYGDDEFLVSFVKDITEKREEELLQQISYAIFNAVHKSGNLPHLIREIRQEISKIIDVQNLMVVLRNAKTGSTNAFFSRDGVIVSEPIDVGHTIMGLMFKEKKSVLLSYRQIRELVDQGTIKATGTPAKIWLGVPLFTDEDVMGIISLENFEDEHAFTSHHLRIMEYISSQISFSIQRKIGEEALKISEKNLRESNISKDKFFSIIAHDLRGPFNAIIGFSEVLHTDYDSYDETEKKTMIRNIYEASIGTYKLLENLLEWSRIQTGRTKPNPENIDLSTIANTSLSILKHMSEKKNIKLFSGIHFGTIAFCDENMITTVIRNLISNAIKFTPSGGNVRIWATTREKVIEVVVADNGLGIDPENVEKLFRLDESYKTKGTSGERGTGLGLILCHEFIQLNGGNIWVETEAGKGSQFKFTLPKFKF